MGCTRNKGNIDELTSSPGTRSGAPPPVIDTSVGSQAPIPSNTWWFSRNVRYVPGP
jgi:hypothetical protein